AVAQDELALLIKPSGYFNAKAKKLKALADFLWREYEDDIQALRAEEAILLREKLLEVYGIGEETADCIVLYVAEAPTFVVDAYSKRLLSRLGVIDGRERYENLRQLLLRTLPEDVHMLGEYHALIVRHGQGICRKTAPLCNCCVLQSGCALAKSIEANRRR
ncbi:MAG: hypothetical protein O2854_05080, partial [Chloroflexi bacterium]|nr:hypothetical protein [Chloroflexota bacterium]